MTETPCRTGAADQPRAERTGRSRVVNTSPWPCGTSRAEPRDCALRPLLQQQELAAGVVAPRVVQVDHHLQREHLVAVQVAVQRVPVAGAVTEQQRRGPPLPGPVTHLQPLVQRLGPLVRPAQLGVPVLGDGPQPGVERLPQPFDRLGQGRGEVPVRPRPEPVPGHVHGGPEQPRRTGVVQAGQLSALGRGQQLRQQRPALVVQFPAHRGPVRRRHPLVEASRHAARGAIPHAAHAAPSRCSRISLAAAPPAYWPSDPSERITR